MKVIFTDYTSNYESKARQLSKSEIAQLQSTLAPKTLADFYKVHEQLDQEKRQSNVFFVYDGKTQLLSMLNPNTYFFNGYNNLLYYNGKVIGKSGCKVVAKTRGKRLLQPTANTKLCASCGTITNDFTRQTTSDSVTIYNNNYTTSNICWDCLQSFVVGGYVVKAYDGNGNHIYWQVGGNVVQIGGNWYTLDYAIKHFNYCEKCKRWHKDYSHTIKGKRLCDDCAKKLGWGYCADCGEWHKLNKKGKCRECAKQQALAKINNYHTQQNKGCYKYWGSKKGNPKGKYIGFELELVGEYDNTQKAIQQAFYKACKNNRLTLEYDGSLDNMGCEVISQPHTPQALKKFIYSKSFANKLGWLSNCGYIDPQSTRAGLHVHVSRSATNSQGIAKLLYLISNNYELFANLSRRNRDCMDYCELYEPMEQNECKQLAAERYNSRYVALNLCNRKTIEWRLWATTNSPKEVWQCCLLSYELTRASKHVGWQYADRLATWLPYLSKDSIEYISKNKGWCNV